jgi:hypothetical protein
MAKFQRPADSRNHPRFRCENLSGLELRISFLQTIPCGEFGVVHLEPAHLHLEPDEHEADQTLELLRLAHHHISAFSPSSARLSRRQLSRASLTQNNHQRRTSKSAHLTELESLGSFQLIINHQSKEHPDPKLL